MVAKASLFSTLVLNDPSRHKSVDLGNYQEGFALIIALIGYFLLLLIERVILGQTGNMEEEHLEVLSPAVGTDCEAANYQVQSTAKKPKSSTPYVILCALSVHAIFEGIALGVQHEVGGVVSFAVGILAHKWAESLALAVAFEERNKTPKQQKLYLGFFTLTTPVGVGIGVIVNEWSTPAVTGTFQALAGGTFIYLACSERFVSEFNAPMRERIAKFVVAVLGAGLIIGLATLHDHSHGHEEHH